MNEWKDDDDDDDIKEYGISKNNNNKKGKNEKRNCKNLLDKKCRISTYLYKRKTHRFCRRNKTKF